MNSIEARFIALTGSNDTGSATTAHDAAFNATVAGYFQAPPCPFIVYIQPLLPIPILI